MRTAPLTEARLGCLPLAGARRGATLHRPVFILGCHKSGTSLLRAMLDGHPELFVLPMETEYFLHAGAWVDYPMRARTYLERDWAEIRASLIAAVGDQNERGDRYGDGMVPGGYDLERLQASLPTQRPESHQEAFAWYMAALSQSLGAGELDPGARVVEKSVMHHEFACHLQAMYPDAVFLHVVRNPYATLVALRRSRQKRSGRMPLLRVFLDTIQSSFYHLSRNRALLPNYHAVRYEDLLTDAPGVMQRVCEWTGLAPTHELDAPTLLGQPWKGNSSSDSDFKGVSRAPLDDWKEEISALEAGLVTGRFEDLLEGFGYETFKAAGSVWKPLKHERGRAYLANRLQLFRLPKNRRPFTGA